MKRYGIIDHPSDIGITAEGKTMKEAFANAAFGMFNIMYNLSSVKKKERVSVKVKGEDPEFLLVNWLNELLYLNDARNIVFSEFKIREINDKMLKAEAYGEKFNTAKHTVKTGIKAATYNQLEVSQNKKVCKIRVIFDV
ncbi:archease [Candidatus Margulisiibacteriota bacterium]